LLVIADVMKSFMKQRKNNSVLSLVTLRWIVRLRWIAVIGQILAMFLAFSLLEVHAPWLPASIIIGITIISNLWLQKIIISNQNTTSPIHGFIIGLDVILLTALLYFTGGPHNPFTSFYLLHIALAAMSLSASWLWTLVAMSIASYGLLFLWHKPIVVGELMIEQGCPSYSWHLQGMAVAFVITSCCIGAFVARMQRALKERDEELAETKIRAAKNEQFSVLATLSAGVAHEIGTPIGTIALASSELLIELEKQNAPTNIIDDAKLIRNEVTRCRSILDRLSERATGGLGDVLEQITINELQLYISQILPPEIRERLHWNDSIKEKTLQLPKESLVQAIAILINNAHEADISGKKINIDFSIYENKLSIIVTDQSDNISTDVIKHASEPFFTTKPPGKGMGLGLFLVRTMALRLGGDLILERLSIKKLKSRSLLI
jgi:two-component system, sensor histidine kinase RegB